MKTFLLSVRLFRKKPFANAMLAVELTIVALITVIIGNIFQYSQNCINVFANSSSRVLFCSNSEIAAGAASRKAYVKKIQNLQKKYSFIKGYSTLVESDMAFDLSSMKSSITNYTGIPYDRGTHVLLF